MIEIKTLFQQSLAVYRQHFFLLWGGMLAIFLPLTLLAWALPELIALWPPMAVIVFTLFFFLLLASNIVFVALPLRLFAAAAESEQHKPAAAQSSRALLPQLRADFWPLIATSFVLVIIIAVSAYLGALFLIIPGIVIPLLLGGRWAVVYQVALLERPAPMAAFSRSSELTAGQRWKIVQLLFLLLLLALALALLLTLLIIASQLPERQIQLLVLTAGTLAIIAAALPFFHLLPSALYYQLLAAERQSSSAESGRQ